MHSANKSAADAPISNCPPSIRTIPGNSGVAVGVARRGGTVGVAVGIGERVDVAVSGVVAVAGSLVAVMRITMGVTVSDVAATVADSLACWQAESPLANKRSSKSLESTHWRKGCLVGDKTAPLGKEKRELAQNSQLAFQRRFGERVKRLTRRGWIPGYVPIVNEAGLGGRPRQIVDGDIINAEHGPDVKLWPLVPNLDIQIATRVDPTRLFARQVIANSYAVGANAHIWIKFVPCGYARRIVFCCTETIPGYTVVSCLNGFLPGGDVDLHPIIISILDKLQFVCSISIMRTAANVTDEEAEGRICVG